MGIERIRLHRLALHTWESPTLTTWASFLVRSLNLIVILPLLVRQFSPEEIAVWYLLATIVSLQLVADFGFSSCFSRLIAYARAGQAHKGSSSSSSAHAAPPDWGAITKLVGSMRFVYSALALAALILIGGLGTCALTQPISHLPSPGIGWTCWLVTLISISISIYGNIYVNLLQGFNEIARLRRSEAITSASAILTLMATLLSDMGLLALVFAVQIWTVIGVLRNRWILRNLDRSRFTRLPPAAADRSTLASVWPAAWRSGVGITISSTILQASGLIYAQLGDTGQVASYLIAVRVITAVSGFSQAPFYSRIPLLTQHFARGEYQRLLSLAQLAMRRSLWVFVVGVLIAWLALPPLLDAINSNVTFVPISMWGFIGLAFFVERYGAMHLQLYSTTNHIVWHLIMGATGSVYLITLAASAMALDYYAFPLAMLTSYALVYAPWSARLVYGAFSVHPFQFEIRAALPPFVTMLTMSVFSALVDLGT